MQRKLWRSPFRRRLPKRSSPYTDGYYLMTPFRRVALMEHIIQNIQQSCIS